MNLWNDLERLSEPTVPENPFCGKHFTVDARLGSIGRCSRTTVWFMVETFTRKEYDIYIQFDFRKSERILSILWNASSQISQCWYTAIAPLLKCRNTSSSVTRINSCTECTFRTDGTSPTTCGWIPTRSVTTLFRYVPSRFHNRGVPTYDFVNSQRLGKFAPVD